MDDFTDDFMDRFEDLIGNLDKIYQKNKYNKELKRLQNDNKKLKTENDKLKFAIKTFNQIKSEDNN